MNKVVRVGSRESKLAVRQAEIVMDSIKKNDPEIELELVTIKTQGDKILDQTLDKIGGKGLFIKELEQALFDLEIDIAVHSYKDMPYEETENLPIIAQSERESPFDALILPINADNHNYFTADAQRAPLLPVGSSSLRRSIQVKALYKNLETAPIRGNVITRINK